MNAEMERTWNHLFARAQMESLSWYQEHDRQSLAWIEKLISPRAACIVDIGGGASTLVGDLVQSGFRNIKVIDIAATALIIGKRRLEKNARRVDWVRANVLEHAFQKGATDLWHDRAMFHFLTNAQHRRQYVHQMQRAIRLGGYVILATFAEDGPEKCCNQPVMKYSASALAAELGSDFYLQDTLREEHQTPAGVIQPYLYSLFRYAPLS